MRTKGLICKAGLTATMTARTGTFASKYQSDSVPVPESCGWVLLFRISGFSGTWLPAAWVS